MVAAGLHISFSPNACAAVMLDGDGQTHLRLTEHSYGAEGGLHDESTYLDCKVMNWRIADLALDKYSAAIAALTLAYCRGCGSDVNTDDILSILVRQLSPG